MKNKRAFVMLAFAILFGLAAVVLAWKWLQGQASANASRVVVATTEVNRGQRLSPEMLRLAERPAKDLPKDAYLDPALLIERVLKANLVRGEVVTESKLAPAGTMGGLSALISEGKRAITVRVNDVIGVAGFALPGNYVDIIVHTERDAAEGEHVQRSTLHVSKIVLERILVLAVAQEVSRDETKPKVVNAVTLEVTPEQAENLDLARGVGTLSLALRNQVDQTLPTTAGATKHTLLDELDQLAAGPKPVPAPVHKVAARAKPAGATPAPARRRDCVNVLNGLQPSQECF
ncbi:MAG: Flp pilus assembly protein CpaB [Pseudomonadota bacterium]